MHTQPQVASEVGARRLELDSKHLEGTRDAVDAAAVLVQDLCMCVHVCACVCMCVHVCGFVCMCMCMCMWYTSVRVFQRVCMSAYVCACMCMHVHCTDRLDGLEVRKVGAPPPQA